MAQASSAGMLRRGLGVGTFYFNRNDLEALTSISKVCFPPALVSMLGDKRTSLHWSFCFASFFLSKFGFLDSSEDITRGGKSTE